MWRKYIFLLVGCIIFNLNPVKAAKLEYYDSYLWSDLRDVKIRGSYAYCVYGRGLMILDISNPESPRQIGQC
jgi:hypothetical protein